MAKQDFRFHTCLRVRWMEGDAQGIVYNGSYMNYLEVAQAEYYRNLGFSIYKLRELGHFDTVAAKVTLEFKAPARIEDLLDVYARVSHVGTTSIIVDTEIYLRGENELVASGQTVYVGYDTATSATKPVLPDLRRLVQHYEDTGEVLPLDGFPELAAAASDPTV